ncbi:MAG: septation protein A [Alphaproteobacteria bacterium]|nr:septation protein A [Alphaproteobacteria bacterium]
MSDQLDVEPKKQELPEKQGLKFLIELGPLLIFFAAYAKFDIYVATGALMVATLVSLAASKLMLGRITIMPIVTAVIVSIFGGLTLWLNDASFIKMKPTIVNVLFAGLLSAGLAMNRPFLKLLFGEAFQLTDEGWYKLTLRWILFFLFVAVLNELVWRNFSEPTWVNFKVFGILPLTMIFAGAQIKLIQKYAPPESPK